MPGNYDTISRSLLLLLLANVPNVMHIRNVCRPENTRQLFAPGDRVSMLRTVCRTVPGGGGSNDRCGIVRVARVATDIWFTWTCGIYRHQQCETENGWGRMWSVFGGTRCAPPHLYDCGTICRKPNRRFPDSPNTVECFKINMTHFARLICRHWIMYEVSLLFLEKQQS